MPDPLLNVDGFPVGAGFACRQGETAVHGVHDESIAVDNQLEAGIVAGDEAMNEGGP